MTPHCLSRAEVLPFVTPPPAFEHITRSCFGCPVVGVLNHHRLLCANRVRRKWTSKHAERSAHPQSHRHPRETDTFCDYRRFREEGCVLSAPACLSLRPPTPTSPGSSNRRPVHQTGHSMLPHFTAPPRDTKANAHAVAAPRRAPSAGRSKPNTGLGSRPGSASAVPQLPSIAGAAATSGPSSARATTAATDVRPLRGGGDPAYPYSARKPSPAPPSSTASGTARPAHQAPPRRAFEDRHDAKREGLWDVRAKAIAMLLEEAQAEKFLNRPRPRRAGPPSAGDSCCRERGTASRARRRARSRRATVARTAVDLTSRLRGPRRRSHRSRQRRGE